MGVVGDVAGDRGLGAQRMRGKRDGEHHDNERTGEEAHDFLLEMRGWWLSGYAQTGGKKDQQKKASGKARRELVAGSGGVWRED